MVHDEVQQRCSSLSFSDVDSTQILLPCKYAQRERAWENLIESSLKILVLPTRCALTFFVSVMATWAYPPLPPDQLNREADSALVRQSLVTIIIR